MRGFVLALLSFLSLSAAADVVLKGHLQDVQGKSIGNQSFEVQLMEDFITYTRTTILKGSTGLHGDFKVTIPNDKVQYLFVDFGKVERYLFVEPGKSYYLDVKAPVQELKDAHGVFAKDVRGAEITNKGKQELNYLMDTVDYLCSKFLREQVAMRRDKKGVDQFTDTLKKNFSYVMSSYFKEYLAYKEAEMNLFHFRNHRDRFAKKYFIGKTGIASNFQRMHVFNSFFKGYFKNNILIQDNSPFHLAFRKGQLQQCLNMIYPQGTRELQELVLLLGIYEVHSAKKYSKSQVNRMLDQLASGSNYSLHRVIAKNMMGKINLLKEGATAPEIKITGSETFSLNSLRGKYVYLCFFQAWDNNFEKEIDIMKILAKKYEKQMHIVCIATDLKTEKFEALKKKVQVEWTFIHYGHQRAILDNYNIEDYRIDRYDVENTGKYYLIDPQGELVFVPAKSPTKGFHRELQQILGQ